ncbi:hypothetical protein PAE9249_03750 [Paenibacillus sp. CECT 9249]|nr:hypothetical protein PAE9249_03750 [Paenibacillus sp. CECT 9249]
MNSFAGFALLDAFILYRDLKESQYEWAPYILQDLDGIFTIGYGKNGWFSSMKYWKTYQSGPNEGQKVYIEKDEFNFWKKEAEALWGRLDFWGNFVPGLLNPELPTAKLEI